MISLLQCIAIEKFDFGFWLTTLKNLALDFSWLVQMNTKLACGFQLSADCNNIPEKVGFNFWPKLEKFSVGFRLPCESKHEAGS